MSGAAEVFQAAYRLYAKYAGGPQGDSDAYWDNISRESDVVVKKLPCGLTEDLVRAVLMELDRADKNRRKTT